jgi:hypothetical protein
MPLRFRKILIADERCEAAAFIDVNNDGVLDIVSGALWYEGPDFRIAHPVGPVRAEGEYYDEFSAVPLDVNGDGYTDFITGGWWGNTLRWRENPGKAGEEWPVHNIAETGNVETTKGWDLDGDGVPEIVPNCPSGPLAVWKLDTGSDGKGKGSFTRHEISTAKQGHGLGAGDINGDGRLDLIVPKGWYEAPEKPWQQEWTFHEEFDLGQAGIPILVADVNGDGLADLIVGGGHRYGLDWYEQSTAGGKRSWIKHPIDPFNSQYHDMMWIDIDGDGQEELVTGTRYRAHCGRDPGARDDVGIYYFKWNGESFSKQIIDFGPPRIGTGIGIYFDMADLTGNGLPDLLAPGKDGLYVFYNEGPIT